MTAAEPRRDFVNGDEVDFLQTCRGGYGFQCRVPAIFRSRTPTRWCIEVQLKDGSTKRIAVHPRNVVPRDSSTELSR